MKINSKAKGRRNELVIAREIADKLGVEYGGELRRTPASGALITRADLWVHPKHRDRFPFFVEIKSGSPTRWSFDGYVKGKTWEPYKWYKEAKEKLALDPDYDKKAPVILVFTKNRMPYYVMMDDIDYDSKYNNPDFLISLNVDNTYVRIITWERFLSFIK